MNFDANIHHYYEKRIPILKITGCPIVSRPFRSSQKNVFQNKTVNYGDLYKIVATEMEKKTRLLEHLAGRMIEKTLIQFPQIQAVEVSVSKYNPPVGGVCERSRVRMKRMNDKL